MRLWRRLIAFFLILLASGCARAQEPSLPLVVPMIGYLGIGEAESPVIQLSVLRQDVEMPFIEQCALIDDVGGRHSCNIGMYPKGPSGVAEWPVSFSPPAPGITRFEKLSITYSNGSSLDVSIGTIIVEVMADADVSEWVVPKSRVVGASAVHNYTTELQNTTEHDVSIEGLHFSLAGIKVAEILTSANIDSTGVELEPKVFPLTIKAQEKLNVVFLFNKQFDHETNPTYLYLKPLLKVKKGPETTLVPLAGTLYIPDVEDQRLLNRARESLQ